MKNIKIYKNVLLSGALIAGLAMTSVVGAAEKDYTVKAGDTLSQISEKQFGSTDYVDAIARVNKIENKNLISVGQKLTFEGITEKDKTPTVYSTAQSTGQTNQIVSQAPAYSAPTYNAPQDYSSYGTGSVVLANGNTAGDTGVYAAQQMEAITGVSASTWEHIIARESNGQVNAYNPSGASGLFQTMPGWGSTATVDDQINAAVNAYNAQGLSAWGY